jgi:hypothetical protein
VLRCSNDGILLLLSVCSLRTDLHLVKAVMVQNGGGKMEGMKQTFCSQQQSFPVDEGLFLCFEGAGWEKIKDFSSKGRQGTLWFAFGSI